ncbi:MAG TPA: hypothetical protein EYP06_00275 [Desulfobacterales bacterium]|nr:hypothetical protein [Desulfobacterales bacterium]
MNSWLLFAFVSIFLFVAPGFSQENLPQLPGKEKVLEKCNTCHGLNSISRSRRSAQEWRKLIDQMINYGLEIGQKDLETVIEYLSKCCGKK